jgi:hypothetical protein
MFPDEALFSSVSEEASAALSFVMIPSSGIQAEKDSNVGSAFPMLPELIRTVMSCSEGGGSVMVTDGMGYAYVNNRC